MASTYEGLQDLAQAICRSILSSFAVDNDLLQFAQSTFGLESAQEIRDALTGTPESSSSELDCLLELILSPSIAQRQELEPYLQDRSSAAADESRLIDVLLQICPRALIHFPNGEKTSVDLDRESMQELVRRLRLPTTLYPELENAVAECVPASWQAWVRVRLRLASTELAGSRAWFIASVLRHIPVSSPFFAEYFCFALAFVQECTDAEDMAKALAAKKEYLEHSLDRAAFLEKQRSSQVMEALLMQRVPMLSIDTDQARKDIQIINDLCLTIFGQVPGSFDQACRQDTYTIQRS